MILCITPNPAIDRTIMLAKLVPGNVHRAKKVIVAAGGKGLNVARSIRILGGEPVCMGFTGGHNGRLLAELAQNEGLRSAWTWTDVETRTCTILVVQDGDATVINETGISISAKDWNRLQQDVQEHLDQVNLICLSGSLPPGFLPSAFQELLTLLVGSGKEVWVDTSGAALGAALACPGICVKVNGSEIGAFLGFDVHDIESAQRALPPLDDLGVTASVITLGSAGAVLSTGDGKWRSQGPQVAAVSTVGSGDAFLAGLVRAREAGRDWPNALYDAVAAGTANTLSPGGGQFNVQDFEEIRKQVEIQSW